MRSLTRPPRGCSASRPPKHGAKLAWPPTTSGSSSCDKTFGNLLSGSLLTAVRFLLVGMGGRRGGHCVTARKPCPEAPGPLEDYARRFDGDFESLAQRRAFREYLQGLLLPRDRNKTLTALANAEPVVAAQHAAVQRLQFFLSESRWDAEAVNARRLALLLDDPATAPHGDGVLV